jgi:hypothetical protein
MGPAVARVKRGEGKRPDLISFGPRAFALQGRSQRSGNINEDGFTSAAET